MFLSTIELVLALTTLTLSIEYALFYLTYPNNLYLGDAATWAGASVFLFYHAISGLFKNENPSKVVRGAT